MMDDDLNIGGDIFSDFNEDLEAAQVMEDERFYRYSRFFGVNIGLGHTTFTGNRGAAYEDQTPSYALTIMYFLNFQNVFIMGFEFSKHYMVLDKYVNGFEGLLGVVNASMLRPFFGFRYYIDTQDLGTAITYSNPYLVGRVEYWYQTLKFADTTNEDDRQGGGLGTGFGFGLEFPIELKKSYFNVEFLYHIVNFNDKFTQDYAKVPACTESDPNNCPRPSEHYTNTAGFDNLAGDVLTFFASYNFSW
jgi:hypothetical protein